MRLYRAVSVVLILVFSIGVLLSDRWPASAETPEQAEDRAEAARQGAAAASGLLAGAVEHRAGIEDDLAASIMRLSEINAELTRVSVELDSLRVILARAEAELASISASLTDKAVDAYTRAVALPASSLMTSEDTEQAIVAVTNLEASITTGQSEVAGLTVKRHQLEDLRQSYLRDLDEVSALQEEADAESARLEALWAEADADVAAAVTAARAADASYRAALDGVAAARARQAEQDRQRQRDATTTTLAATTTTAPPGTSTTSTVPAPVTGGEFPPAVERWRDLATAYFPPGRADAALAVISCESGGDPHAYNPYSGASGLFQFLPSTWAATSPRAGFAGADVFDPEANIGTAAWLSAYYDSRGSGPWAPWTCRP